MRRIKITAKEAFILAEVLAERSQLIYEAARERGTTDSDTERYRMMDNADKLLGRAQMLRAEAKRVGV